MLPVSVAGRLSPAVGRWAGCFSCRGRDMPPPATAALDWSRASQKSRLASIARDGRGDALARFGEQREHVDLHGVVAQQRFVRDDLAQRQDFALIVAGDVVGGAIGTIGIARLRADDDRMSRAGD